MENLWIDNNVLTLSLVIKFEQHPQQSAATSTFIKFAKQIEFQQIMS